MSRLHVLTSIMIRSSCHHWNKLNLAVSLPSHISIRKVKWNSRVFEHDVVKPIHDKVHSPMSSQSVIKRFLFADEWRFFVTCSRRTFTLMNNVTFHWIKDLLHFFHQILRDRKCLKGLLQILPSRVELKVIDLIRTVGCFHVFAMVIIWAACDHAEELDLTVSLFLHVCVIEIEWNSRVLKHEIIKFVNYQTDSIMTTQSFIQCLLFLFFLDVLSAKRTFFFALFLMGLFYSYDIIFHRIKYFSYFFN